MDLFHHLLLGLVQGVTEFLPVSSSAHLVILQELIGFNSPTTLFDAFLHLGTLIAVIIVYRKRISDLTRSLFTPGDSDRRYIGLLILGTIPIVIVGLLARDIIESAFHSSLVAGTCLLFTGLILWAAGQTKPGDKNNQLATPWDAVIVGLFQVAAVFPGISRSGMTISGGIFRGFEPKFAAEFSFLLMLPAVLGANILQFWEVITSSARLEQIAVFSFLGGFLAAILTGILAIKLLIKSLEQQKFKWFAVYCWSLGLGTILWVLI